MGLIREPKDITDRRRQIIEELFKNLSTGLAYFNLKIDHHAEFCSFIKNKNNGEIVASIHDNGDIKWIEEEE